MKWNATHFARPLLTGLLLSSLLVWAPAEAQLPSAVQDGAIIEYSGDPSTPIIEVTVDIGMLEGDEDTPRLRIYGDGRVHANFPVGMKRAGDYQMFISESHFADILTSLSTNGVMSFDEQETLRVKKDTKAQRASAARASGQVTVYERSDDARTTITVNLSRFKAPGTRQPTVDGFSRTISWYGIQTDAQDYPEIEQIANLAAVENELLSLCDAPNLQKIDD